MNNLNHVKEKFNKALAVSKELREIFDHCDQNKTFDGVMWSLFWDVSEEYPFSVDYYDPDTSYESDMRARLFAVEDHIDQYKSYVEGC